MARLPRPSRQSTSEPDRFARFGKSHLRLEDGRPLVVEDFQRRMLAEFFDGTTETIEVHPPAILTPPQDGSSLDAEDVFGAAEAIADRWPGCLFVLDPEAGGEQLAQRLDRELKAQVLTHSQKAGPMCQASQLLAEAIAEGTLRHPDHEGLTRHVLSAGAKFYGVGWRLVKPSHKSLPIDAAVALAMAVRVLHALEDVPEEPRPGVRVPTGMVFA